MPGEACADLFEIDVAAIEEDFRNQPPVFIVFRPFDLDALAHNEVEKILLRSVLEILRLLGHVNAGEANLDLPTARVNDGDRVAVHDADDAGRKSGCL